MGGFLVFLRFPYNERVLIDRSVIELLDKALTSQPADRVRFATARVTTDPLQLVDSGAHLVRYAAYLGVPGESEIGALGNAWRMDSPYGADRFAQLSSAVGALDLPEDIPVLVGFSFASDGASRPEWDEFTPSSAVVPLVSIRTDGEANHLYVVVPPNAEPFVALELLRQLEDDSMLQGARAADHSIESHPTPGTWEGAVADAVNSIREGGLQKAVLARSLHVRSDVPPRPFGVVRRLRSDYPSCFVYGWQEGEGTFVGASPELLVARRGSQVRSHPLAGSAPRGPEEEADQALGEELMASSKNRAEHQMVVDDIAERLASVTTELRVDPTPSLRKVTHVQHLSTEIAGTVADGLGVVELAGRIHPTPAVGGSPRDEALSLIRKSEGFDRGWYAGGIGWTSTSGDGEIALALRCALLRGDRAWLYAGAGIVADSVPASELEETRLKFRTMVDLLTEA